MHDLLDKQSRHSVNIHTLRPQISPRQVNLLHEFCMCLWYIVECQNAVSELEEKVGAEGYKNPEGQLRRDQHGLMEQNNRLEGV
jgi:hypothetical protein